MQTLHEALESICNRAAHRVQREDRSRQNYADPLHIIKQQLRAIEGRTHEPAALLMDANMLR